MRDKSLIKCKICGEVHKRFQDGKYPSGLKRWVNEKGEPFNGRCCPKCNQSKTRCLMRIHRYKTVHKERLGIVPIIEPTQEEILNGNEEIFRDDVNGDDDQFNVAGGDEGHQGTSDPVEGMCEVREII